MREIKFRAWHPNTKELMPVECIDWDEGGYLTEVSAGYTWGEKFDPEAFSKLVLMQYTGLKDKNGKEIYEGDVFRRNGHVGTVEWGLSGWLVAFDDGKRIDLAINGHYDWLIEEQTVIGNIYENPDLLKP